MARLTGLFQRGGSYYLRIVLPQDHPLKHQYPNGRWVQTLGPGSHREAVIKGTIKRAEVLGAYSGPTEPTTIIPRPHTVAAAKPIYLRDVYDRWTKAMPRTADTVATCGRALKLFEEQASNPPIQQLTRAQGESFRSWLQTLPSSSKTARDRLIWVRALLKYAAEDLEWIVRNPWERLDMPFKTTSKRRPWTDSELRTFFSLEIFQEYKLPRDTKAGADAAYWIPLLGIYTGARLGELAQLRVDDVKTTGEMPLLSISDVGDCQSVKTEAGVRQVPVHRELLRLGFLDYVEAQRTKGEPLLWPMLPTRTERPGGYFSQWFGVTRRLLGFGMYPDFHCLRHTVRSQMAEAEVPEHVMDTVVGHEVTGGTGNKVYTHRTLKTLKKAIEVLHYPALSLPRVFMLPANVCKSSQDANLPTKR